MTLVWCRLMPILAQAKWLVRPEYGRYSSSFTLQVYFLFLFFPTLSHPGPSLGILGGLNFCADRRGGGHSIEGVLPVGACDTDCLGASTSSAYLVWVVLQIGVPDVYRVAVSHTPGVLCVGHTQTGLETQALQDTAGSSLLG